MTHRHQVHPFLVRIAFSLFDLGDERQAYGVEIPAGAYVSHRFWGLLKHSSETENHIIAIGIAEDDESVADSYNFPAATVCNKIKRLDGTEYEPNPHLQLQDDGSEWDNLAPRTSYPGGAFVFDTSVPVSKFTSCYRKCALGKDISLNYNKYDVVGEKSPDAGTTLLEIQCGYETPTDVITLQGKNGIHLFAAKLTKSCAVSWLIWIYEFVLTLW